MINTNYLGMRLGNFEVIGYNINLIKLRLNFNLRCERCGISREVSIKYEKILRIKCRGCGRLDIVLPIEYYGETKVVKDTISVGEYKYNKLRKELIKSGNNESEIDFIRRRLLNEEEKKAYIS